MADSVKIDLEENSKYRVAFELAGKILKDEMLYKPEMKEQFTADPRAYWLKLYAECLYVKAPAMKISDKTLGIAS